MTPSLLACTKCNTPLTETMVNRTDFVACPACSVPLQVEVYPALFRQHAPGREGETLMVEGESSCFYHPQKKAVVPCHACGRFLCALCDCELHGEHFCPACLEVGRTKGKIQSLENQRTLYDSIALSLAVLPVAVIFGIYFTFITAPMALFVAVRYWNAPRSIIHRTKARYIIAIILASLQLIGWGLGIYFLTTRSRGHG